MRLGWRRPRVDSLKLAKLHKNCECAWSTQENFRFLLGGCRMYNYWGDRKDTGLCEPLWSIRLNCQSMTKLEMMHTMQTQVWCCISAHPRLPPQKTKRETGDASKSQLNQARWNRTVLIFGSENLLNFHNFQSFFVIFPWLHDMEKSRHYQFDWMCAAHLEYRSLVLKNVRITGIWTRKN